MQSQFSCASFGVRPTHDEISALAYQLYVGGGGRAGMSLDDWLCAEFFLTCLLNGQPAAPELEAPAVPTYVPPPRRAGARKLPGADLRLPAPQAMPQLVDAMPPSSPARPQPKATASRQKRSAVAASSSPPVPALAGAMVEAHAGGIEFDPSYRWRGINE